jgi:hypothetical protein
MGSQCALSIQNSFGQIRFDLQSVKVSLLMILIADGVFVPPGNDEVSDQL